MLGGLEAFERAPADALRGRIGCHELRARLQKVAVDAYRALRVKDYGRVDLRLTETGEIYVLEVNASCYLEKSSEFAMAAGAS